jgi:VIT1/CCC1 family predicted Fe2+/Mn2+ transporter
MLESKQREKILTAQRNEITEHFIYKKLASVIKDKNNSKVLLRISREELAHYDYWKSLTHIEVVPNKIKVLYYVFIGRVFGLTFAVKLMETAEGLAQDSYVQLKNSFSEVQDIIQDEARHEKELIELIDEERLKYVGSIVLGLNDAIVELTGALVGFTLALQNTRLVAIVGLIVGFAASMSMSASEYLSTRQEQTERAPLKASIYTGFAYIITVFILILPYLIFNNIFLCLSLVITFALLIVFLFTFYISVAKELSFKHRFLEMAGLSLIIAAINFVIGLSIRRIFGIEI